MLVVTAIIGLLTGVAVFSLRALGGNDPAGNDAKRLLRGLSVARELAELEQRSIGLQLDASGYRYAGFSARRNTWYLLNERSLPAADWSEGVQVQLILEGRAVVLDTAKEIQPQLGVAGDGDYTPFELELRTLGELRSWRLRPTATGALELLEPSP